MRVIQIHAEMIKFNMMITLAPAMLLAGCAEIKPSWNGFYGGFQNVSAFDTAPTRDSMSAYGNFIINLGSKNSLQIEPIIPLTRSDKPLLRLAVDRKLF